ncbi:MAG: radical SAM protein [Hyphomicrobiales bacterium]|nr:radical SAM protein [Hyphomicrobiales bacterium]MBV8823455.1 radical SAM protein [Hyphomicrobiales bacterium]
MPELARGRSSASVIAPPPSRLAPASSYELPRPDALAAHIIEGKRELDRTTLHELWRAPQSMRDAPPAVQTGEGKYRVPLGTPLPLVETLSHRLVDGAHLWIGVEEGIAITMSKQEHALFLRLRDGTPPDAIAALIAGDRGARTRRRVAAQVHALIGRLATAGFVRGIEGYTDVWKPQPRRFMRLHLTQRCNLSCVHCYADSSPHVSTKGQMSVERWLKVIDDFADAGGERILFTGGEALVYPGCDRLLERAHARRLDVTLFSNGILIQRHIDAIRSYVDQVQISIDGPDAATNDPIRGPGSFRRAVEAVDFLVAAGVRVRIGMVVMERNWAAMKAGFIDFTKRWDGRNVEFRLGYGLTHHGRGDDIEDSLDINDTRPVVEQMMEQIEGSAGPRIARRTKGCGYAEQIVVASDGSVHPCHLLDGAITHVDKQPMAALIGMLEGVAQEYDVDHNLGCNRCDIRNLCGGTCRIQNGKATGNRRVTNCTADDKLHRLRNLVRTFSESDAGAVPANVLAGEWE